MTRSMSRICPRAGGQAVKTVAYLRVSTPAAGREQPAPRHPGVRAEARPPHRRLHRGNRLRTGFREAPPAGRADERTAARRPSGRQRTLPARPVAGSGRRRARRPRQGGRRLRGPEGEHPRRGQARHPDEGHDHALRAVRRGRARPDLRAHPRGPRQGQGLGPQARSPEGVAGRLTARRQGGRDPALPRAGRLEDRHRQA